MLYISFPCKSKFFVQNINLVGPLFVTARSTKKYTSIAIQWINKLCTVYNALRRRKQRSDIFVRNVTFTVSNITITQYNILQCTVRTLTKPPNHCSAHTRRHLCLTRSTCFQSFLRGVQLQAFAVRNSSKRNDNAKLKLYAFRSSNTEKQRWIIVYVTDWIF